MSVVILRNISFTLMQSNAFVVSIIGDGCQPVFRRNTSVRLRQSRPHVIMRVMNDEYCMRVRPHVDIITIISEERRKKIRMSDVVATCNNATVSILI